MDILFFGSSQYCLPILKIIDQEFNLIAVITKPPKPVGKNHTLTPAPPKQFASSHNIQVFTPENRQDLSGLKNKLEHLKPDLFIVADYGLIIPREIFSLPAHKTINIHFSKLPHYRGPSPVQYTILNGDTSAWISFMLLAKDLDTGDILSQIEVPLKGNETADQLYRELFGIGANKLSEVINKYISGQIKPIPQDHTKATYTKMFTKEDGYIPFEILHTATKGEKPTETLLNTWPLYQSIFSKFLIRDTLYLILIERSVRALSPWPGVWTLVNLPNPKRLKLLKCHLQPTTNLPVRQAGNQQSTIIFIPDLVQLEGKKPVSWKQFREGYPEIL